MVGWKVAVAALVALLSPLEAGAAPAGKIVIAQGDVSGGLAKYREGLSTLQVLSLADPKNVQFQKDTVNVRAKIAAALHR